MAETDTCNITPGRIFPMPNAPSLVAHKFEQRGVVLHFDGDADQEPDPRFSEKFFIVKGS